MKSISLLLVDKSQLFREGLRRILADSTFLVDMEASSLHEAAQELGTRKLDLVLFDFDSAGTDMRGQIEKLREARPGIYFVILTERACITDLASGLGARVDGYLLKDMSVEALRQSLSLIMMGQKIFPGDLTHLLVNERIVADSRPTDLGENGSITPREKQILSGLLNGLSNKSIAKSLGVAEATVKALLKSVLRKIGMRNRTQAAVWALTHGIAADAFLPSPRMLPRLTNERVGVEAPAE